MSLAELTIDDLRCIEHARLELHPGQNLIWGGNGSGKTSLLESIFLLGRGRSFRTRNSERLIRYGRDRLVVFGRTGTAVSVGGNVQQCSGPDQLRVAAPRDESGEPASTGIEASAPDWGIVTARAQIPSRPAVSREEQYVPAGYVADGPSAPAAPAETRGGAASAVSGGPAGLHAPVVGSPTAAWDLHGGLPLGIQVSRSDGTLARIGGATAKSLTELAQAFPVQVIDPGIHKLVEEGGHRRRRWLDWGVFHVEHQFGDQWLRYTRIVKQRNAALRSEPDQAGVWDPELVRLGQSIADARGRFVEQLLPHWRAYVAALSGLEPELHYFRGWAQDVSLADALKSSLARDRIKGITHPGPHRADLVLRLNGRPAREVLSRGQQKMVAVAMTLAQLNLVQEATQTTSTLLLDDPAAELDGDHLKRFIEQVMSLRCQLVLTSLNPESQLFGTPDRVFHVEQGRVQPV